MSLEFQSRNISFGGRENRDTHKDEHKRIKPTGSNTKVIKETDESKRSGRNTASEYTASKTIVAALRKTRCCGLGLKTSQTKSNNRLSEEIKKKVLDLLKSKYQGFGPALAHEKPVRCWYSLTMPQGNYCTAICR
jgi:hypothetical protein